MLKRFNVDKATPLSTPMVVRSLNVENDSFRPHEENEDMLGPEVPYLSAIGSLMYLANCTRPNISFAVNLLARFSSSPTNTLLGCFSGWNGIDPCKQRIKDSICFKVCGMNGDTKRCERSP